MPTWLSVGLAAFKDLAAPLISLLAVWIALRGRTFDARRSYSEFVLKQRIDAATRLMQASVAHFALLADVADMQRLVKGGSLAAPVRQKMIEDIAAAIPRMKAGMAILDEANAAALPYFSRELMAATGDLSKLHYRAISDPESGFVQLRIPEVQQVLTRVLDVIQAELDIAGVIKYQGRLFK